MRILLFEDNPPRFYKEIHMNLLDTRLIPVNMYAYLVESGMWIMRHMGSRRAGMPAYTTMDLENNEVPKEILAMALLFE